MHKKSDKVLYPNHIISINKLTWQTPRTQDKHSKDINNSQKHPYIFPLEHLAQF